MVEQLTVNSMHTVEIIDYSSNGGGIAKIANYPLFIAGVIKGETVKVEVTKLNKGYGFAKVLEIVQQSTERVTPKCAIYEECGGCQTQHMTQVEEDRFKRDKVEQTLSKIGKIDTKLSASTYHTFNEWDYRNKLIVPLKKENGSIVTGFFAEKSHTIIPFQNFSCPIQNPLMMLKLKEIIKILDDISVTIYDEKARIGYLRNVYLRANEKNEILVTFITSKKDSKQLVTIAKQTMELENVIGVCQNVNNTINNELLGKDTYTLQGKGKLPVKILGVNFEIAPNSFLQVNYEAMDKLYSTIQKFLVNPKGIIDLYCGSGTITLNVLTSEVPVIGVEIVESSIKDAKQNKKQNNIENVEFILGDASQAFKKLSSTEQIYDTIIVDPPRKGLIPKLIEEINDTMNIKTLIYVSCDVATLARDIKQFVDTGWKINDIESFNMFQKTNHIETIVKISR